MRRSNPTLPTLLPALAALGAPGAGLAQAERAYTTLEQTTVVVDAEQATITLPSGAGVELRKRISGRKKIVDESRMLISSLHLKPFGVKRHA